ncbi:hypothetical protein N7452_005706 [Penicillium brevicompactum]|uniref:Uncharacterized protein n=1 Tax=Penicillium brevicompactum TaxID=5074 RepID=A0A9W9QPT9_PENBR|nr:hypothetical protein N7452_005706 [Penicillium brevicompactum]
MSPTAIADLETPSVEQSGANAPRPGSGAAQSIPIAIVGMACRFPGDVENPSQLWELCVNGKDGWTSIPEDRFDVNSLYHKSHDRVGRSHVQGGYFMKKDISLFDAAFFSLASDVASGLDPQARLMMESVYEATEDAGIPIEELAGTNTSVYAGTFNKDYHEMQTKDAEVLPHAFLAGTGTAMIANRLSHFYDLQGPSMSIDTGCSAGIVAIHQGCQSIRSGESDISIVGAASTLLTQDAFISASSIGAIGDEGKCFAWDERAHGYGRGEGVATMILQPLDAALKAGKQVHAVIRDSGLNQDGKTTTITSPSADAQVKLIRECYKRAGFNLSDTGYVEAHMTGTAAGDPIEAEAISRTFGQSRAEDDPINVGSVKTNLGHTEPVSGLAAVMKTVYALKNQTIPPNLNYAVTNPAIDLKGGHLQVPIRATPWPKNKLLRASVNNFGYGGTNGHVILDPSPTDQEIWDSKLVTNGDLETAGDSVVIPDGPASEAEDDKSFVYLLSAKDSVACDTMMRQFAAHITQTHPSPSDLAYTLTERRSKHNWVAAVRAKTIDELAERLANPTQKPLSAAKLPRLGFVFNGQGAQWHAMGRELIDSYPAFGQGIRQADEILKEYGADWSLKDELMRDATTSRVGEIQLSQPISVAVQLCLGDLLASWGILPSAVTSHSSGEIAAAYATKALSFREALGVAYFRGELALKYLKLHSLRGGMLATAVGPETAEQYIAKAAESEGRVVVACVNSPSSVTLSGDISALDEVAALLEEDGVFARKLKVPMAYHSHHMEYIEKEYIDALRSILPIPRKKQWGDEAIFVSPVTGEKVGSPAGLTPEHWARNMTSPVLFSHAFQTMSSEIDMVLEIGAHGTLAGPIRQILKAQGTEMPYATCLKRPSDAVETMQDLACDLIGRGYPVNLKQVNSLAEEQQAQKFVTGLPSYPWNHSKKYWVEPRISREQRFKKFPPHELLGTPLNGSNGLTPTWRNFLRLGEIPWLKDHQIDGSVVFPGAGYIANAIEAVRLLTDPSEETIHGYRLRDIDIINAMIIPDTVFGIEIQLTLHPCSEKEFDHDGWWQFELSSLTSGGPWIQHCKGYVSAETGDKSRTSELTRGLEAPEEKGYLQHNDSIPETEVDIETLFSGLRERGIYHGPEFQNLVKSRAAGKRAITDFTIANVACEEHDYVLHPTTLDSILQASFGSLPKDMDKDTMVLPRFIRSLSVPKDFRRQGGEKLRAFSEMVKADKKGVTSSLSVVAANAEPSTGFLQMQDFFGQAVPKSGDDDDDEACMCSKSCWELDVLHNFPEDMKKSLAIPISEQEVQFERNLNKGSYFWILDALTELKDQNQDNWEPHHRRMVSWMQTIVEKGKLGNIGPGSATWHKTSKGLKTMHGDELGSGDVAGRLVARVGRNLAGILRGDINPLELMMEGNLLNQFYGDHQALKTRSYKQLSAIAELYAIKRPGAHVLEIGAGTGGATTTVLEGFSARGDDTSSILGHYTFTDVSPAFLEGAKAKFAGYSSLMDYKKLDIESDPFDQGFTGGSYDLIVSSFCLHATKDLAKTMSHVRKLLKPGGTLLLIEATADSLPSQLIFGTLPGWWLGVEPERQNSPNAPLDMWDRVLQQTGFTGVDLEVPDYEDAEFQSARVISSRATTAVSGQFSIVLPSGQSLATAPVDKQQWLSKLADEIQSQVGVAPPILSLDDEDSWKDTVCIFTAEMEAPFVDGLDAVTFEKQRKLLLNSGGLLWLSCGGLVDATDPSFGATDGLIRSMRQEDAGKRWIRLDFDNDSKPWTENKLNHILHVLQASFDESLDPSDIEWEYAVKDSLLRVSRSFPDKAQDALARDLKIDPTPELQPFKQQGRPLIWEVPASGTLGLDPYFTDNLELTTTEVPSGMVEVEAKAYGLNFREVMVQLGQLDEPLKGHECSGIVTALGPNTEQSGLKVGDRVCALVRGRMASRGRTWWTSVAKLPARMAISWEEAASFPAAYVTAYGSLIQTARLQKGESVLVHAAAGGTGQAAVILAQSVGAEVFATCSTKAKRDLLMEQYGIPEDHIFSSRDASFAPAIMASTAGKGVDVVLNSLSGPLLKATWDCVARFGRFVDITKMDIEANRRLETSPFGRCAVYTSFDLLQLTEYCGRLTNEALVECVRIVHDRSAAPVYPITPYSISEMATAMRQMQGGQHKGKLVLVPRDGDQVKVVTRPPPLALARDDATYLISGGLGGIGRAIASWFIENGAKNVVLVSRNATKHDETPKLLEEAQAAGCRLLIRDCDVSDEQRLLSLLQECSNAGLPTIRGAITGAMVLNDSIMERMTFEQWSNGVRPKIDGSRNLHKHLPAMEFYIMLSSVAGVAGHMSQANYAAGNTYQDALARHRTSNSLPAVTIDLGAVRSVGYVADQEASGNENLRSRVENVGFGSVDLSAVLGIIDVAIRDPLRKTLEECQIAVGPNFHAFAKDSAMGRDRRFGTLRITTQRGLSSAAAASNSGSGSTAALVAGLKGASSIIEASILLVDALSGKLSDIFSIPLSDIDPELPLARYGVDSLVAVELRNWISGTLKAKVSVFEVLQSASLTEFATLVASKSEFMVAKGLASA